MLIASRSSPPRIARCTSLALPVLSAPSSPRIQPTRLWDFPPSRRRQESATPTTRNTRGGTTARITRCTESLPSGATLLRWWRGRRHHNNSMRGQRFSHVTQSAWGGLSYLGFWWDVMGPGVVGSVGHLFPRRRGVGVKIGLLAATFSVSRISAGRNLKSSKDFVGLTGFEPATPTPPVWCATKLRHSPLFVDKRKR